MVISESVINSQSASSYQKTSAQNIRLIGGTLTPGTPLVKNQTSSSANMQLFTLRRENFDQVIFTETQNSQKAVGEQDSGGARTGATSAGNVDENNPFSVEELKETLVRKMMEALTGKRFEFKSVYSSVRKSAGKYDHDFRLPARQTLQPLSVTSLNIRAAEVETQSVSYSAKGVVKTADGKTINLDLNMAMSQSTATYMEANFGVASGITAKPIDPLIINYGGTAASLTDEKFDFDLDADGTLDKISFAGEGSGFLALDKNGDGKINDGNELFGPRTNNGFEELRKYDSDGNGWIDEADDVYGDLRIWSKDKDGNDVLYTLKELDVGAIYLNDSATDYTMYDAAGNAQGAMRSTSFFLKDSGGAGFVSHFDLFA